jgi:hypothetical protein
MFTNNNIIEAIMMMSVLKRNTRKSGNPISTISARLSNPVLPRTNANTSATRAVPNINRLLLVQE